MERTERQCVGYLPPHADQLCLYQKVEEGTASIPSLMLTTESSSVQMPVLDEVPIAPGIRQHARCLFVQLSCYPPSKQLQAPKRQLRDAQIQLTGCLTFWVGSERRVCSLRFVSPRG